jgi:hypothetical protein
VHQKIEIFTGQVFFSAQKNIEDKVALGRAFEALLLDVRQEYFLFFSHDPRRVVQFSFSVCVRLNLTILAITIVVVSPWPPEIIATKSLE